MSNQPAHKLRIGVLQVTIWRNPERKATGTASYRPGATKPGTKPGKRPTASASTTC